VYIFLGLDTISIEVNYMLNIDDSKSYKTEENLKTALTKLGITDERYLIVCNRSGRFTAVFPVSSCNGDMTRFARHGFMTLG